MFHLALKMLVGDRAKFLMLLGGLFFAALLMTQQCAVFFGLLSWTTSHLSNIRSKIWVVEAKVEQVNELKPLRDTDVSRVRSVPGVAWAVPLYVSILQARLADGNFKPILCVGLDSASLVGRPAEILSGRLEDIRLPNSVIVDDLALQRLKTPGGPPPKVGDIFEINDREARIVAICKSDRAFFGYPYVFTTYDQALQFAPRQRKMLSAVLAEPAAGLTAQEAVDQINRNVPGMRGWTEEKFHRDTIIWYFKNTGIPISFGVTIILGFIVGIAISGQTFYGFVLENLKNLGALKAMGASNSKLAAMLITQVMTVGLIGYGLGMGAASLFGALAAERGNPPFFLPWQLVAGVLAVILLICLLAAALAIVKVGRLEAAVVFRG